MRHLSDKALARLRDGTELPDLSGTRYRLIAQVARGGMGVVYAAEDQRLQRRVALKVLEVPGNDGDLAHRLMREACVLARLEHPGIVPVHDAGALTDGRAFYCMKYVEGQTLAQHVAGKSLPEKLRLLERIAEPLDFAHARGFVHRDLKPENIMIGAFGEVLIMDWGLATMAHTLRTGQGGVLGTPGYMSPEQARGTNDIDHRTDIFSLGAILAFMLTGMASGEAPTVTSGVAPPLRAICEKALAADPDARYRSAGALAADTVRYLGGEPVLAHPEGLLERAGRVYARHRTAIVLITVYLLMRFLFILFARS